MKIGFISLGCSKNTIDTEMMLAHLDNADYEITADAEQAEIILINTCGFIGDAREESIETIREMARLKKTGKLKKLIVTGCLAERWRNKLMQKMPEIDAIVGLSEIHKIVNAVRTSLDQKKYMAFGDYEKTEIEGERMLSDDSPAVFLRISEGCDNRCSYCAIPKIRGRYRSRTMESIIEEAQDLEAAGAKEINLIAEDTSRYGTDLYHENKLPELLHRLAEETTLPWIRIFYCYPDRITDELIAEMRDNPRVLPYLDMPIQHISDPVLKRMNRGGSRQQIETVIEKLRREIPDMIIRTTVIVGFPGETDERFNELLDFIKKTRLNRVGAFSYSREEGTAAYDMPDQIAPEIKQQRYEALMEMQAEISLEHQRLAVGQTRTVLCEEFDPEEGLYIGRDFSNGPEVDGKVFFSGSRPVASGDFVRVKITEANEYDLFGEIIE
ncbi:MAG: 30S ribosomal protein S12 methylthiotransferase RimO [Alphaproteobacteria bacterium]|nr:30S ribosomal protein S12 methylthiotransferase RimO [Alphaproteobacteria bacterium]